MAGEVDPKNANRHEAGTVGFFGRLRSYLPERFYVRESLVVLTVITMVLLVIDFTRFLHTNQRFYVTVKVKGLEVLSRETVMKELDQFVGTPDNPETLMDVSVKRVRSELLERIPRFKRVSVRKDYPGTLRIRVVERTPVALISRRSRSGGTTVYLPVDREGVVFRPTTEEIETLPKRLPVVRGFPEVNQGTPSFERRWQKALNVLDAIDSRFSSDILKWVQVRTGGYVQIVIKHPKELTVRLGETRYKEKLDKLKEMMQTNQFLHIKKYVNLTQLNNIRAM